MSITPPQGPRVKGTAFRGVIQALEVLRGQAVVEQCQSLMPDDLAAAFRYKTLLASGFYPIEWYRELLWSRERFAHFELDGAPMEGRPLDVDRSGRLLVETADGRVEAFGLDRLRFAER